MQVDNNDIIFAGTDGYGVFKSTNNGNNWIAINNGLTGLFVYDLEFSPEGFLLAATNDSVFRYWKELNFWNQLNTAGLNSKVIRKIQFHNNVLYVGTTIGIATFIGELPVEISSFTADLNDRIVTLNWSTASEINNYGFEIEKQFDQNDWYTVGFIKGNGTTANTNNYSFSDDYSEAGYSGKIFYRLKQIDYDGTFSYSKIVDIDLPAENFQLYQNYPNPFNPKTKIKFSLPEKTKISLVVTNILGEEIIIIFKEAEKEKGNYEIDFDGSNLSSGVYFYTISAGDFISTKKMIITK
jgi:hypothetical protein